MKTLFILILAIGIFIPFNSCYKKKRSAEPTIIGTLAVDLDANHIAIRKKEALIGNVICDALKSYYENKSKAVDFVIINSGSIRYSSSKRPSGIYLAGDFSAELADEMLPFGNTAVITRVTGKQLKEIFERSVAKYPLAKGNFLQVSKEVKILIDTTQTSQVLNVENTAIVTNGSRIVSIKINNKEYDDLMVYKVGISDFLADGNDGYVTFKSVSSSLKEFIGEDITNALKEYVITNSPINPNFEGRIMFQ